MRKSTRLLPLLPLLPLLDWGGCCSACPAFAPPAPSGAGVSARVSGAGPRCCRSLSPGLGRPSLASLSPAWKPGGTGVAAGGRAQVRHDVPAPGRGWQAACPRPGVAGTPAGPGRRSPPSYQPARVSPENGPCTFPRGSRYSSHGGALSAAPHRPKVQEHGRGTGAREQHVKWGRQEAGAERGRPRERWAHLPDPAASHDGASLAEAACAAPGPSPRTTTHHSWKACRQFLYPARRVAPLYGLRA